MSKMKGVKACCITDVFHEKFPRQYFDINLSRYYINKFTDENGIKHKIKNKINTLIND